MKIEAQLKQDWLTALKSGEYVQGTSHFMSNNKHCCLGVLCEVAKIPLHAQYDADNWDGIKKLLNVDANASVEDDLDELWKANDGQCDGKYTVVIPLIEAIPTT